MTLEEIKQALADGKKVYWSNGLYKVIKDSIGQYFIYCESSGSSIGLTWSDGKTLNGKESEFYIEESNINKDELKWANSSDGQLYDIAKTWAKKWSTKKLRAFQQSYLDMLNKRTNRNDVEVRALQNRWQCATFAISIKEFGV